MARTMQTSKPKKSKAARAEAAEPDEAVVADPEAAAQAAARRDKKKKSKKRTADESEAAPVNEGDEGDEEEGTDAEETNATDEEREKKTLRRRRERKRVAGYRSKATECGFRSNGVIAASGIDCFASALTQADAKRLMRFVPEVLNQSTYDKTECAARMKLSQESVPASAARETQARCEAVMRKLMNDAVLRTVEKGVARVDASIMQSVLRPYQYGMPFSSVLPPKGLLRHAQHHGVLSASAADEAAADQEKAENKELSAAAKALEKKELARKEAWRKRQGELVAARAGAVASTSA